MDYKKDLKSMGYREMAEDTWAKPIGFHIFIFTLSKKEWINFFKGVNNQMCIWQSYIWKDDNEGTFLDWLKSIECYTSIHSGRQMSEFHFLTKQEYIENLLN